MEKHGLLPLTGYTKNKNRIKSISLGLGLLISLLGCSPTPNAPSQADLDQLNELHENYRAFWLENDSLKVLSLFSDEGALIPPNNSGDFIQGKEAMNQYWFTVSGNTRYPITQFDYLEDELVVVDASTAVLEGVSTVSWNTVVGDSIASSSTSTANFLSVCVKERGEWKILRHMWNVRPPAN